MAISLKSSRLDNAGFSHGFSTREVDLQLGRPGHADDLARFAEDTGIAPRRIAQTRQVHGTTTVLAEAALAAEERGEPLAADALVASDGAAAGVRVADCVPILGGDPSRGVVVAIHAGWKGAVGGVVQSALTSFTERGGRVDRAIFAIGPCICRGCFEIGEDVARRIAEACGEDAIVSGTSRQTRPHADLRRAVRTLLERAGAGAIEDVPGCTRCDAQRFFSYRRDGDPAGRHLAAIAPRPSGSGR